MARPTNRTQRRVQIARGLLKVMARDGYRAASTQRIAKAAGLTPGLVHYHFANKEEILLAALSELEARWQARYDTYVLQAQRASERLDAFVDSFLAIDDKRGRDTVACWVVLGAEALQHRSLRKRLSQMVSRRFDQALVLVGDVLREEGKRTSGAHAIAATLLSMVEGAFRLGVLTDVAPVGFAATSCKRVIRALIDSES